MPNINFQVTNDSKKIKPVRGVSDTYDLEIDVTPPPAEISNKDFTFGDKSYTVNAGPRAKDPKKGYISFSSKDESYLPNGDYVFVTELNELYTKEDFNSETTQAKVKSAVKAAQKQPDLSNVEDALEDLQTKIKEMSVANLAQDQQQVVDSIISYYAPTLTNPPGLPDDDEPTSVTDEETKSLLSFGPTVEKTQTGVTGFIADIASKNEDFRSFMILGREQPTQLTDVNANNLHDNLMLMVADLGVNEADINKTLDAVKAPVEESESDLTVSEADFKTGQQQISAILDKIDKLVDNPTAVANIGDFPGRPDVSALDVGALGTSYLASEFNPNETYNVEIKAAISTINNNTTDLASAKPFLDRPGMPATLTISTERSKSSNDEIAKLLRDFGGPYVNYLLSQPDSTAALKLLKAGREDKLDESQKRLYKNVLTFTALFGTKDTLEKMLDDVTVNDDGSVSAPAKSTPSSSSGAGAPVPTQAGAPAPTTPGAPSTTGSTAPSTPGEESSSGAARVGGSTGAEDSDTEPGAAAPVNPIGIGVVVIVNARPAKVTATLRFTGPNDAGSGDVDRILTWQIPPEFFSGYQLQISDDLRPAIMSGKGKQAVLEIKARPLTGGAPISRTQTLMIRPYNLPEKAAMMPVLNFIFGKLSGTQEVLPARAAEGGATDFSKRNAFVPCFFYKKDGGVGEAGAAAEGSSRGQGYVAVVSAADGKTYDFDFPDGILVPIRLNVTPANVKLKKSIEGIKTEQKLNESKSRSGLIKEGGVPHWIFLKPGRKGAGGGLGAGDEGEDGGEGEDRGGLKVNVALKRIRISTTDKLRIVGNVGVPWDESSFKAAAWPGTGAEFNRGAFPEAGIILCKDDLDKIDAKAISFSAMPVPIVRAIYDVLFSLKSGDSAYRAVGLRRWADDITVIGSNLNTSATAREKPDRLFASA